MADVLVKSKEAIVIVLDVGKTMHHDSKSSPSVLEKAKTCINMILQRKIFSESKDEIALVLFGTKETANNLANSDTMEYNHITVAQELKPANWELLNFVQNIEGTQISADFIDALVVAMDILRAEINGKNFTCLRILFFSNFDADFCQDQVNVICEGLKIAKMELNVIGPHALSDDQNQEESLKLKNKTTDQIKAESVVRKILKEVNGESYSFDEALPALIYYQKKKVQSLPWNANLDIGKNLTIPISAYIKIYECKTKPWKNSYAYKLNAKIEKETSFHLNDEAQTEVSKDNIIPAYRFGTTLVPFSEEDKVNMEYQSGEKGMKVLGFTKEEHVYRYYYVGDKTMYVFGQKNRELAGVILAPFIQALYETKMVAIVRYVYSSRSAPKIGFLAPRIKPNYECLVFVALPFMEDLRHFVFAPLDTDPKNLPTDEQLSAIDELITTMDLSVANVDEDGKKSEALKPKNTVNPYLQRLYQCLQHRAFHPTETKLPEVPSHIKSIIEPPQELLTSCELVMKKIKSLFPLKDVAKKRPLETGASLFSNGQPKEDDRPDKKRKLEDSNSTANNVSAIGVVENKITEVGTVNPVQDFLFLIKENDKLSWFQEVCKQMEKAILKLIGDAMVHMLYDKIITTMKEYRCICIKKEEPLIYNKFVRSLKSDLFERTPVIWNKIIEGKLGIISSSDCLASDVSVAEAVEFYRIFAEEQSSAEDSKMDDDESFLLDQM